MYIACTSIEHVHPSIIICTHSTPNVTDTLSQVPAKIFCPKSWACLPYPKVSFHVDKNNNNNNNIFSKSEFVLKNFELKNFPLSTDINGFLFSFF
jgi:hypothetical protein